MAVTTQPMSKNAVHPDMPFSVPQMQMVAINVPPGLEYLTTVNQIYIKQKVELLEAILGCETKNKYDIRNGAGELLFKAKEDTDCCTRNCCGPIRPFDIEIKDPHEREIIHLERPFACQQWCFPCCLQTLTVSSPPGTPVGTIEQIWSCYPSFVIKNVSGEVVLTIEGPFCPISCCNDVDFKVFSADGTSQVGKISKQWSGAVKEWLTDADNFGIEFPVDLDVRVKATLLGACFLIDFMYFEKSNDNN